MNENTYQQLEDEVWTKGICSGCGACVAVCPPRSIYFEAGTDNVSPLHNNYCKSVNDDVSCGVCYKVCPRVSSLESKHEVEDEDEGILGEYSSIVSGRASLDVPRRQSGGAVTSILVNALEAGLIDSVVTVAEDPWTLKPYSTVISDSDILISKAGSRYNWWVPLVSALDEAVTKKEYSRIAIVGVPCVIEAIDRIRNSDSDLLAPFKRSIRLTLGLFCTETFDYRKLVENKLKLEYSVEPMNIKKFDIKGKLEVTLEDNTSINIPLNELDDCVRQGCNVCTDFTATHSDISAGSIGSPEDATTLIIRTEEGKKVLDSAVKNNRLVIEDNIDLKLIEKLALKKKER
ncbi:Coenzyme F420 hydrogenase/dehydrogenase, beta subunit C-terminal domain [Methanosalsum natronophilum]|uniref:4Fe-4S ferredoxin-type domain-containing protein n=1 Tax=Methanosalsum natronophilum TaxID=768733 RepID=A0A3R7XGV6_9EURY|nr:Coenzyme F420 hydrogenase/dehydrogenase, beta subunit C-terminal domain [Methanosalsum natronophilum]MCS3924777.1 coenzyme F420 hydrogenase subunit beta [Methanosalsum natronophilum]RQD82901.1 MAG: hypothetical protein D5R95_06680 [Methanosalsum natronophilum]